MTMTTAQAQRQLDAIRRHDAALAAQAYIVVRKDAAGDTLYLNLKRKELPKWCSIRVGATEFATWRKARNAARKHEGLTSPARLYP